ncbi:MAG: hypothetical protein ACK4NB_04720 [Fimbriimonadales bacterium]
MGLRVESGMMGWRRATLRKLGRCGSRRLQQASAAFVLVLSGLTGCQSRAPVRVDIDRAMQALSLSPGVEPPKGRLAGVAVSLPADSLTLAPVQSPPPVETVSRRRRVALDSTVQQREAVRQRLLELRLQPLPELEQRWRAELRDEYDLVEVRQALDAAIQEAFQQYGRQRFPLLVALVFAAPESDAYRQTRSQLEQLDRAWQAQERALRARYEAGLARIEQEIEVRVNARRREFIRNAEQEAQEQLAQQPDLADLYLPQPQSLPPAPVRKTPLPAVEVRLPEHALQTDDYTRRATAEQMQREMLTQLAQEWADVHNYQLTNAPNAPDKTDEFVRYLLAK